MDATRLRPSVELAPLARHPRGSYEVERLSGTGCEDSEVGRRVSPMPKLTPEEFDFLRELAKGPRTISGPRSHAGLKRLVKAAYVSASAVTRGDTSLVRYEITDKGRAAVEAEDAPPVESTDKAGEAG
jgi:hypothetical protein